MLPITSPNDARSFCESPAGRASQPSSPPSGGRWTGFDPSRTSDEQRADDDSSTSTDLRLRARRRYRDLDDEAVSESGCRAAKAAFASLQCSVLRRFLFEAVSRTAARAQLVPWLSIALDVLAPHRHGRPGRRRSSSRNSSIRSPLVAPCDDLHKIVAGTLAAARWSASTSSKNSGPADAPAKAVCSSARAELRRGHGGGGVVVGGGGSSAANVAEAENKQSQQKWLISSDMAAAV